MVSGESYYVFKGVQIKMIFNSSDFLLLHFLILRIDILFCPLHKTLTLLDVYFSFQTHISNILLSRFLEIDCLCRLAKIFYSHLQRMQNENSSNYRNTQLVDGNSSRYATATSKLNMKLINLKK
jgi:hypothetical protein